MNVSKTLQEQAKEMSTRELEEVLSWQKALSEHVDEIGVSYNTNDKINVIQNELNKRRVYD